MEDLGWDEIGNKLKCLRYDNGGEFYKNKFNSYYPLNGIWRVKIIARTPHENGV